LCFSNLVSKSINQKSVSSSIHSNRRVPFERLPRALNRYFHCRFADIFAAHRTIRPEIQISTIALHLDLDSFSGARQSIAHSTITYDVGMSTSLYPATVAAKKLEPSTTTLHGLSGHLSTRRRLNRSSTIT
jgi:hypothetical protein